MFNSGNVRDRTIKIQPKIKLYRRKLKSGFPLQDFYQEGNGIKTILQKVGRLTDIKGIFVIINRKNQPIILGESQSILADAQKLVRGVRVKDQIALEKIAELYGFSTVLAGQTYIRTMKINWLEITNKVERIALKRALESTSLFTI
ncbi:MAG: hypothetical protein ABJF11_06530 [Reichenbachiella sp.]|uniref:hypothetical protein n=1 Tax=Reichenbachiella sp. TaxID=2184521 RepID=UPI003267B618